MSDFIPHSHRIWLYALGGLILLYLLFPTLIVIPMSFSATDSLDFPPKGLSLRWYDQFFTMEQWQDATIVSLKLAFGATILATPLGTAAAYALHAGRMPLAKLIQGALVSALVVPLILFAISTYFLFAKLGLVNTLTGLILVNTVLAVPYVLVTVTSGLKSYDMNQERVAQSLGASRFWAFLSVTLPQIKGAVFSGALFAFLGAFDEVVIATFLSSGDNATLTNRMFASLRDEVDPTIAAVSTLMILLTMGLPLAVHLATLSRRRGSTLAPTTALTES